MRLIEEEVLAIDPASDPVAEPIHVRQVDRSTVPVRDVVSDIDELLEDDSDLPPLREEDSVSTAPNHQRYDGDEGEIDESSAHEDEGEAPVEQAPYGRFSSRCDDCDTRSTCTMISEEERNGSPVSVQETSDIEPVSISTPSMVNLPITPFTGVPQAPQPVNHDDLASLLDDDGGESLWKIKNGKILRPKQKAEAPMSNDTSVSVAVHNYLMSRVGTVDKNNFRVVIDRLMNNEKEKASLEKRIKDVTEVGEGIARDKEVLLSLAEEVMDACFKHSDMEDLGDKISDALKAFEDI